MSVGHGGSPCPAPLLPCILRASPLSWAAPAPAPLARWLWCPASAALAEVPPPPGLSRAPRPWGALSAGEARSRLRWADGKTIKNEVDLQVGVRAGGWVLLGVVSPVGSVWDLLACPAGGSSARDCLPWVGVGRVRGVTAGQGHLKALGHQEPFLLLSVSLFSRCCICWGQRQKLTWKRSQR